jgi:hypothetical protein
VFILLLLDLLQLLGAVGTLSCIKYIATITFLFVGGVTASKQRQVEPVMFPVQSFVGVIPHIFFNFSRSSEVALITVINTNCNKSVHLASTLKDNTPASIKHH